eukprot:6176875-Pleurochrysis_carterae.AAC.2
MTALHVMHQKLHRMGLSRTPVLQSQNSTLDASSSADYAARPVTYAGAYSSPQDFPHADARARLLVPLRSVQYGTGVVALLCSAAM